MSSRFVRRRRFNESESGEEACAYQVVPSVVEEYEEENGSQSDSSEDETEWVLDLPQLRSGRSCFAGRILFVQQRDDGPGLNREDAFLLQLFEYRDETKEQPLHEFRVLLKNVSAIDMCVMGLGAGLDAAQPHTRLLLELRRPLCSDLGTLLLCELPTDSASETAFFTQWLLEAAPKCEIGLPGWAKFVPSTLYWYRLRRGIDWLTVVWTVVSMGWALWQLYHHFDLFHHILLDLAARLRPLLDVVNRYLGTFISTADAFLHVATRQWNNLLRPIWSLVSGVIGGALMPLFTPFVMLLSWIGVLLRPLQLLLHLLFVIITALLAPLRIFTQLQMWKMLSSFVWSTFSFEVHRERLAKIRRILIGNSKKVVDAVRFFLTSSEARRVRRQAHAMAQRQRRRLSNAPTPARTSPMRHRSRSSVSNSSNASNNESRSHSRSPHLGASSSNHNHSPVSSDLSVQYSLSSPSRSSTEHDSSVPSHPSVRRRRAAPTKTPLRAARRLQF
ncbi:MAG: hypothetical protein MHM6MM_003112 [Cercozoa sp. M6MM]